MHALLYGTGALSRATIERAWKNGQRRVLRYDPLRGAAFYVVKTVLEEASWCDVFAPRRPPLFGTHA